MDYVGFPEFGILIIAVLFIALVIIIVRAWKRSRRKSPPAPVERVPTPSLPSTWDDAIDRAVTGSSSAFKRLLPRYRWDQEESTAVTTRQMSGGLATLDVVVESRDPNRFGVPSDGPRPTPIARYQVTIDRTGEITQMEEVALTERAEAEPAPRHRIDEGRAQELASLRAQLQRARESLLLIDERRSQYVQETDVPLQLVREQRRLLHEIEELERRIKELNSPV